MTIECVVLMVVFAITSLIIGVVYVSYMYTKDINEAEQQIKALKRRAEIAERAYALLIDKVLTSYNFCVCSDEDECANMRCAQCIKKYYTEQSEKDLAEERENAESRRKDN